MSRVDIVNQLYRKMANTKMVEFDQISQPAPLAYFFSPTDVGDLHYIATSNKLAAKPDKKYRMISEIMGRRGFKKLASGTNRVVYKFLEDQRIVVKTALDSVGITDNPNEFYNQKFIKPYCTKVFEVTPCGTLGMFERVHPISSREEFLSVADDIYDIIINHLLGHYVVDDFGSKYFMNWAVRQGAHPVLCDFPYVFELDGAKLICNKADPFSPHGFCGGEIDYDDGFNHLVCKKCGKKYIARDLKKASEGLSDGILITDRKGDIRMNIKVTKGDKVIQTVNTEKSSGTYKRTERYDKKQKCMVPKMTPYEYRQAKNTPVFKISVTPGANVEDVVPPAKPEIVVPAHHKKERKDNNPTIKVSAKPSKNIKDYVEDDSKFNQNTSVHDQPIADVIAKANTGEYPQIEDATTTKLADESIANPEVLCENDNIEMEEETVGLIDTVIKKSLAKLSGEDEDYKIEGSVVGENIEIVDEATDDVDLQPADEERPKELDEF